MDDSNKQAAVDAILQDKNGYTQTAGVEELLQSIYARLHSQYSWGFGDSSNVAAMVTSGTAGALTLACLTILGPGDVLSCLIFINVLAVLGACALLFLFRVFQVLAGFLVDRLHAQLHFPTVIKANDFDLDLIAHVDNVGGLAHPTWEQF